MTEYDFSPEAYERYIRGQHKIASWVQDTNQVPKANPYQAATPAVDVPRELLPSDRLWDPNVPWLKSQDDKKKARKKRTPSEKEFDRERRNDYKYSHREHMDALRAATTRPDVHRSQTAPALQRSRRVSNEARTALPPPLQARSFHPGAVYPTDHRFSDSQGTTSSSKTYDSPHLHAGRHHKRSASVQPAPATRSIPGPTPVKGPTPYYVYGAEINGQVDTSPSYAQRQKPTRSQTAPISSPPTSAPVYPSPQQQKHYTSSHTFPRRQQPYGPSTYPYTPSPLSPPHSAPAQSGAYPRLPASAVLNQEKSQASKPHPTQGERPFLQRMFMHLPGLRTTTRPPSSTRSRSLSQPPSQVDSSGNRPQTPTSPTKTSWLGSPTKNKLTKAGRSRTSLDQWSFVPHDEAMRYADEKAWSRPLPDDGIANRKAREKEKESRRRPSSAHHVERGYEESRKKDKTTRDDWSRERERGFEWQDQDRTRRERREKPFENREREEDKGNDWMNYGSDRNPQPSRQKEGKRERYRGGREHRRDLKNEAYGRRGSA